MRKISIVSMLQGNVLALRKTLDSFKDVADEFVLGDMMLFESDRDVVEQYKKEYNLRTIRLPFNYICQMGFSSTLNYVISNAKNDMVLYTNVSEAIDEDYGIKDIIQKNTNCNTFYFTHRVEKHRWFRCFDRRELSWGGLIHEEPIGDYKPYHKPIYMMKDFDKDIADSFKSKIFNDVKEINYFEQYIKIVDNPSLKGITNDYWLSFSRDNYNSMKERLSLKGNRYTAFKIGDFKMLMNDYATNPDFEKERFESSTLINFQGARKDIL